MTEKNKNSTIELFTGFHYEYSAHMLYSAFYNHSLKVMHFKEIIVIAANPNRTTEILMNALI